MANAYSILHNYDQPLFQPNVGLIANVLEYKQNKLDVNRQQLQSAVDQFSSLDMIRDVDKEYANKRLKAVTDTANKYAGSDLSDAKISAGLQSQVEQFMDDNVLSAVASTRLIRAEDAEWEQQRIKNPEKYADLNRAYASQARQPYLQNEEVGAEYRGGGGFIEFTDINKLIQDNIMDIQKATKSEYVQTEDGGGYFKSTVTKEAVDRGTMANAIDALFGEKEKSQLSINAWGAYSQAPEDIVRQEYSNYMNQKIANVDENLAILKQLKASKTNSDDIAKIQSAIDAHQRDKEGIVANSNFDTVMQTKGRTAINNLLYRENLKDNFLNAYSYEPRTLKIEVDEVDKANRNYELQLRADARGDRNLELREQEFMLKASKVEGVAKEGTDALGDILGRAPIVGDQVEMPNNPEATLKNYNDERKASMKGVADIFGIDPKDSAKMLELQELLSTDITEKSVLKFNNKTIDLNSPRSIERNRAAKILKFQMYMKGEDPITKNLEKGVMDRAFGMYDDLTKMFVAGDFDDRDFDSRDLRNFGFRLEKSGDKFKVVDMTPADAKKYYINLMRKEDDLTESELATKRAYALAHPMMDSAINNQPEYKKLLANTYNKFLMSNVDKSELNKVIIPLDHDYASNYGTDNIKFYYGGLSEDEANAKSEALSKLKKLVYLEEVNLGKGLHNVTVSENIKDKVAAYVDVAAKRAKALRSGDTDKADNYSKYLNRLESEMKQVKRYNPAFTYTRELELSEIYAKDAEVTVTKPDAKFISLVDGRTRGLDVGENKTLRVDSFATRMSDGLVNEVALINKQLEGRYKDLQLNEQVFTKDIHKDLFKVIAAKVDQVNPVKVVFERELNDAGKYEGIVKYKSTNSKGEIVEGKLNQSVLEADNIPLSLGKIERNIYNAAYGEDAPIVNFGKGTYDNAQLGSSEQVHVDQLKEYYMAMSEAYPQNADEINRLYSDYENGRLSFTFEANDGRYEQVIRRENGELLHRIPTDFTELTDTDLQRIVNNSIDLRDGVFLAYMTDVYGKRVYRSNSITPKQQNRNFTGQ